MTDLQSENSIPKNSSFTAEAVSTTPLLKRVSIFLDDGNWQKADEYCEKVLDQDPENAQAYLGKLMAQVHVREKAELKNCEKPFDGCDAYKKVLRYGDPALQEEISGYAALVSRRCKSAANDAIYEQAKRELAKNSLRGCNRAIDLLRTISGWRDADSLLQQAQRARVNLAKQDIRRNRRIILGIFAAILMIPITFSLVVFLSLRPLWARSATMKNNDSKFTGWENLQSVRIGNGVTSIGENAFSGCAKLTSVTIPDSVTSIGDQAFSGCAQLTAVQLPNNLQSIGTRAFSGCTKLSSVNIPDGVTRIEERAFSDCIHLTDAAIPDSVTILGENAFRDCAGLTSVTLPKNLTKLEKGIFSGCEALNTVTIPKSVVVIRSEAFRNCSSLTRVAIPDRVTTIESYAFYGCSGLTSITIPESVTTIGNHAFQGCSGLKSITFSGTKAQWEKISKGTDWHPSSDRCTIYCSDGNLVY